MDSKTNSIFGLALEKCLNRSQRWKRMQIRGHWAFELPIRQEKSGCSYHPTKKAMCYLGALLLRRLSLLDKLLFLSGRSADSSMGYIEIRHMLTFNLMSVAMLSEIATFGFESTPKGFLQQWTRFSREHDLAIICREIGGAEERANESSNVIRSHSHWTICQSKQKKRKKSGCGLKRN
uniref:Pentatricopeptide repeat-containing protein n=1 Tax=Globodera pallida TaxID=36090 RepID=A0A183BQ75_GLOPA